MTDRPEDPAMPGEPPMAPPPPPPAAPDPVALESETEVRSGGIAGRVAAGALGLVLLVGGVAFAATQMGSSGDGAEKPEEAVAQLFDAMAQEDVLGLLGTLDPRERDALAQPVEELFDQLERLEVLDDSFQLDGVQGVDLEFQGLTFRSEPVRADLARVYLTGGTASYQVDTDRIPVGDFLADSFERFGVEYRGIRQSGSEPFDPAEAGDTFLVAREVDGAWRVSLGYTAVEAARLAKGAPVPAIGAGLAPIGAASPEEAVRGLLQAAVDIDLRGVLARLSPGELGAVHDYWPVLVGDAELPTADDVPAEIDLVDLELRSTTHGRRAQVFIDSIGADVTAEDFSGGATVADGCIELRGDATAALEEAEAELQLELPDGRICKDDVEAILEELTGEAGLGMSPLGGLGTLGMGDGEAPAIGITVVQVDGAWYVAPLGTYADLGLAVLETLDRADLDGMVDGVEELFGSGFFGGGVVGGGFVPPGMGDQLEGFEEFEEFEELGEPIEAVPDAVAIDTVLEELVRTFTADPAVTACTVEQLHLKATTEQVHELVDAHQYQYEPSVEAQDALFGALSACGG